MSFLVQAIERNPQLRAQLKTYSLPKSPTYYGYGIAFHTEAIQPTLPEHKLVYPFIEIEAASPSADVGMIDGQRVVAVNGDFVNKTFLTIEDIVAAIEDSYNNREFTNLTVLDPELWLQCMETPSFAAELAGYRDQPVQDRQLFGKFVN
jgi:hypothetical protein